jgi:flavorubredoxin
MLNSLKNNEEYCSLQSEIAPLLESVTDESVLIHTGDVEQAKALIPQLIEFLGERKLQYIFASHFESDECGGLSLLLKNFPEAKTICSETTARQLGGFGITNDVIIKKPGEKLTGDGYELEFISYPSEMHLWEGLLLVENKRGIFFSSDIWFRKGGANGEVIDGNWQNEVNIIGLQEIPNEELKEQVKQTLSGLKPKFIATGHGPCVKLI